ncbi:adhesion G-protein coupled receptor G2-like [Scyliorhinus canicula]|uniref:adhesion G-protein coupled receptor G2-like n=1 Tax=Scyliorhinus canicula TaxID=7830 RepID=UPI0018F43952|nr:adhesion G-protein coupled receptor G2-like [Scyliorhinus canicula]
MSTSMESPLSDCINQKDKLIQLTGNAALKLNDARYAMLLTNRILEDCNEGISVGLESNLSTVMMKMTFSEDNKTFVTPNVEAGVIKDLSGSSDFNVIANFSWVGAEVQMVYAGVRVKYKISSLPQRAVVTHLKNKTTIQGQERIPVSPSVTVQLGTSSIVGLTTPLTITAPGLTVIQPESAVCSSRTSSQGTFDQDRCHRTYQNGIITCSCNSLGFIFTLTLESKTQVDLFGRLPGPFKITTQSNNSDSVKVPTPATGSPCATSRESTTSVSSSTGPNERCNYLFGRFKNSENEQCLDSVKTANELIQRCTDHIPNIASISSILENRFTNGDCEGETQVAETENITFYVKKINPKNFTGIQFPNSDTENISTSSLRIEINLPSTILDNVNINNYNTTALRIIFLVFKNTQLFQDENNSTILNNLVIGIKVGNLTIENLKDPVNIVFQNVSLPIKSFGKCVFWDLRKGSTRHGDWSEVGCSTEMKLPNIICKCNHLTSFAVLLGRHSDNTSPFALSFKYIALIAAVAFIIFITVTTHCFKKISKMMQRSGKREARSRPSAT